MYVCKEILGAICRKILLAARRTTRRKTRHDRHVATRASKTRRGAIPAIDRLKPAFVEQESTTTTAHSRVPSTYSYNLPPVTSTPSSSSTTPPPPPSTVHTADSPSAAPPTVIAAPRPATTRRVRFQEPSRIPTTTRSGRVITKPQRFR